MKLITCEFNMDSGCVELRFDDGTAFDINCTAIEDKCGLTIRQRRELDGLVYNAPLEYAKMVFNELSDHIY